MCEACTIRLMAMRGLLGGGATPPPGGPSGASRPPHAGGGMVSDSDPSPSWGGSQGEARGVGQVRAASRKCEP